MFDQSSHPAVTFPSAAFQNLQDFSLALNKVAATREADPTLPNLKQSSATKHITDKMPPGGVAAIALKLVKQAKENPSQAASISETLDLYFLSLNHKNLRHAQELTIGSLVTEELVLEYFFKLGERVSYSEKSIYLNFSSLLKLVEFYSATSQSMKVVVQKAVQSFVNEEYSTEEETKKFNYKLSEEQMLRLIEILDTNKTADMIISQLAGYFAAVSGSIPAISFMVRNHNLSDTAKRVAFEHLAVELIKTDKSNPKELNGLMSKLRTVTKVNSLSEFSLLIENVVIPVLLKDYSKAWNSAYNSLILPGQKSLISNLFIDMLKC
jgi:hypothetical protein